MNKKLSLFVASLLMSAGAMAQWVKPADPAVTPRQTDTPCYLYNKEAGGFLLGANDWGTRASYSATLGHVCYIENGTAEGSYYIANDVLAGGMAGQKGYMFFDDVDAIYVDNTIDGKKNNQYTFIDNADGTFKISFSDENVDYRFSDSEGSWLGAKGDKGDTRLYFFEVGGKYDVEELNAGLTWYCVSPADYDAYTTAVKQYDAAVALGESIEQAKVYGVSTTEADAVYANENSTADELTAAKIKLDAEIRTAGFNAATMDNPYTIKFWDFEDQDASAWTSTVAATNKGAANGNNAADFAITGIHYENWSQPNFSIGGRISTTATDTPAGVYRLTALAFTNSGTGVTLFAGKSTKPVTTTNIDINNPIELYTFILNEGQLEYGIEVEANRMNWVGFDNVHLEYLGTQAEAYQKVVATILENAPKFDESTYCDRELLKQYTEAKAALEAAKTPEEIRNAVEAFDVVLALIVPNAQAWSEYVELIEEAEELLSTTKGEGEEVDALTDYLSDSAEDGYNGNGGAQYILENLKLSLIQLDVEKAYLKNLIDQAQAASMADGDDCTSLIANANFTEEGGWSAAQGIEWPVGREDFRVFQAWGRVADVHQNLTGLQNGIYEMNLQGVYKTDSDEETYQCYAYINDFDTKIPFNTEIGSAEAASDAFIAGTYPVKVYGLVTDGTMKLGIANRLRTGENGILWAGGVNLTFRAKNEEACAAMTAVLIEQANALAENYCGAEEMEALNEAKAGGDDAYDALKALKVAIDNVKESTTLYAALNTAIAGLEEAIENNPNADPAVVATAKGILEAAKQAYEGQLLNIEAATQAIEDVNAASVAVKLGKSQATEDNPADYSNLIVNNNFDPEKGNKDEKRIDGWVVEGALNGYKQYTCSFNKGTFDLHQELSGLPKGKYEVTVHTYYRAGSYEEEGANILAGKDTHLMKLYANDQETSVMNLSEGSKDVTLPEGIGTKEINGITVPDGTGASATCFAAGLFLNKLRFTVGEDGKAVIGLRLPETIGSNDYTVVGEWNLWYMGDAGATEQDVTSLIVNNDFDPEKGSKDEKRIDGWNVEGALNGYKQNTCSFNKGTFSLNQTLSGLPAGKYKVTVNTYYRAGSYEEEGANILAGKDTHLMMLYAENSQDTYTTSIMNLSEGSKGVTLPDGIGTKEINGIIVPDGTGASVECFKAGLFLNELNFVVLEDGKATIGLYLNETIGSNDYTVVGPWHLYYYGEVKEIEQSDVSDLIVNNNFDPEKGSKDEKRIDGWNVEGALNGYKSYTCSFNKGTFELSQSLTGLPEGTYKVTVNTYYRAGSYEEEGANILAGNDTHLMKLYAATSGMEYAKSIMNLSEGSTGVTLPEGIGTKEINGITVPDGTGASVECFKAGLFLNTLPFYVSDGKATIGLYLRETIGSNDYTVVGPWHLYYYGSGDRVLEIDDIDPTVIEPVPVKDLTPVAYFSLNGTRLAAPQRGINIVKMSDGSVVKVLVK